MPIQKGSSRYKNGKQIEIIEFEEIQKRVEAAKKWLTRERVAFFWLLYWTGVRKSEAYERTAEDVQITPEHFIINFHKRKKGGLEVPPLRIPRSFPGVDLLIEVSEKARERKPHRKLIEVFSKKCRKAEIIKAHWLFPHTHRTYAWITVKRILGKEYYPHFLRLNRISEICQDPTANIARISSFTGIKSLDVIEHYLGASKKEQDAAIDFIGKQIKPHNQKRKNNNKHRSKSKHALEKR